MRFKEFFWSAHKTHTGILLLLAFLIPSGVYFLETITIAALFLNWFFRIGSVHVIRKIQTSYLLLISLFLLYVISLIYTNNVNAQSTAIFQHLAYAVVPISLAGHKLSNNEVKMIKKVFVLSTVTFIFLAICYAFVDFAYTGKSTVYVMDSIQSKFTYYGFTRIFKNWHPTYVSLFCNLAMIFTYNEFLKQKKYYSSVLLLLLLITAIFLLNSITGIVTFFLVSAYIILSSVKLWTRLFFVSFGSLLCVFIAVSLGTLKNEKITNIIHNEIKLIDANTQNSRNHLNVRLANWQASFQLFKEAPLIGVSPGDYRLRLKQSYLKNQFIYGVKNNLSSHNQFLTILSSFGVVGFLLFITILIYPSAFSRSFREFILVFSLFCFTEDLLLRQQGIVAFAFFYCVLQSLSINLKNEYSN